MMTDPVPIYVYKCDNDHTFEVVQSMSEDALDACEVCGGAARRMLFAPAVHFKGSGFYTTDYARKGAGKDANGAAGEGAKESSESKSESKGGSSGGSESKGSESGSATKSEGKAASSKD